MGAPELELIQQESTDSSGNFYKPQKGVFSLGVFFEPLLFHSFKKQLDCSILQKEQPDHVDEISESEWSDIDDELFEDDPSDDENLDDEFIEICDKADMWETKATNIYRHNFKRCKNQSQKPPRLSKKQSLDGAFSERRFPQIIRETRYIPQELPVLARQRFLKERKPRLVRNSAEDELERAIQASLQTSNNARQPPVLDCGLTAAQIQELASRELTPEDYELLLLLDNQIRPKTVDTNIISKFPKKIFSEDQIEQLGDTCSICYCDYSPGEELSFIPACNHGFHSECIQKWLSESSTKCPLDGLPVVE
jgi:hypothetical protein